MKIFISWSGGRSQKVATYLSRWLKCVLQASKPWLSSDMDRGVIWFNEINEALANTSTGIICLTAENLNSPWILFEAGSLSNGLTDKRVCTFLIDIKPADVEPPLSQFNHTEPNEAGMLDLVKTINGRLGDKQLDSDTLETVFNTYYPQFSEEFDKIISETTISKDDFGEDIAIRSEQELLEEVLITVRNLNQRIRKIENSTSIRNKQSSDKKYITKADALNKTLNLYEPLLEKIVRDGDKNGSAINDLVLGIINETGLPIKMAKDIAEECIRIKELEYQEYLADSMRG